MFYSPPPFSPSAFRLNERKFHNDVALNRFAVYPVALKIPKQLQLLYANTIDVIHLDGYLRFKCERQILELI